LLEDPNVNFDPLKLTWLGSLTSYRDDGYMLIVNKAHKAKTFADTLSLDPPIQLGGTAAGATNIVFGLLARDMLKARVGLVRGFPGVSEVWLAMERGELDGQVVDLSAVLVGRADAWRAGAFRPLVVFGRKERMPEAPDAPTARELGVTFVPYSPLGRGFLTGSVPRAEDLPDGDYRKADPRYQGENYDTNMAAVAVVKSIATAHSASPAQVAIAWLLANGPDVVPIPGCKRRTTLIDTAGAAALTMSAADIAALDTALPHTAGLRYGSKAALEMTRL
jgi:hypothetical protein